MKRYIKTAYVISFVALALAGCSKTDEFQHNPDSALQIESVSGISPFDLMQNQASKAVITGDSLPGDEAAKGIGLFVTAEDGSAYDGHDSGYSNVKYTYNGSKWNTTTPIYLSGSVGKLYGYFPYNPDATDLHVIPVESSLNGTDYLYANIEEVSHSDKTVDLQMKHALSRLHLTIKKGKNFTAEATLSEITLKSTAIDATGTMDLTTGAITPAKLPAETGKVDLTTEGEITVEGIEKDILLVPADNSAGKKDIAIFLLIDGKSAGITLSGENGIDIRSGIQNNVILTIEDTGIKVTGVGVGVWGEGGSQQIQVGKHTVTVKLSDDIPPHDILIDTYAVDDNVIIAASSRTGKHLKCTLNGEKLCNQIKTDKLSYTFTLSDISSDVVATVEYAKALTITTVVTPEGKGVVDVAGDCYEGETMTLTITPSVGDYVFVEWLDKDDNSLGNTNPIVFRLIEDITIKAVLDHWGILAGEFSVSDTKKVHFSRGNLYYDANDKKWNLEYNQYDFRTYSGCGSCINGIYDKDGGTPTNNWGLFGWVGDAQNSFNTEPEVYGVSTSTESANYTCTSNCSLKRDWGQTIGDTWRTLTKDEWEYLLGKRTNYADKSGYAIVNGVNGLIMLPDGEFNDPAKNTSTKAVNNKFVSQTTTGWDSNIYSEAGWKAMETAGAIFLPAAGVREGSNVSNVGTDCYYWSKTGSAFRNKNAFYAHFVNNYSTVTDNRNYNGRSVRLVTDVQ